MRKRIRPEKIVFYGVISGIVGPSIMGIGMLVSALSYVGSEGQRYSILNHFVSELGELGVSDLAWFFNDSLFIGGLLTTFFMVVLAYQITSWVRYPLGLLSVIATLCGALVGVYPMNNLDMHTFVAMTFFNLGMFISFLYSVVFLFGKNYIFPKWLALPGLLNAGLFMWFLNFPPNSTNIDFDEGMQGFIRNRPDLIPTALLEWAIILGILLWVILVGINLFVQQKSEVDI